MELIWPSYTIDFRVPTDRDINVMMVIMLFEEIGCLVTGNVECVLVFNAYVLRVCVSACRMVSREKVV